MSIPGEKRRPITFHLVQETGIDRASSPSGSWSDIKTQRGGGKMGEDAYEASPSLFSLTFSRALQSASRDFSSNSPTQKARTLPVMDCHLIAAVDSFTHSGWRDGGRGEEEKRRRIFFFFNFFFTRNLRTYSGAPIWIPSLCRRELGGIEPDQRGEGLRHPVGDHRHGAEHDADLQQRHRHLFKRFAFLGEGGTLSLKKPSSFYRLRGETRQASRGAQRGCLLLHPGLRIGCSFFGHLQIEVCGGRRTSRTREEKQERDDRGGKKTTTTATLDPVSF